MNEIKPINLEAVAPVKATPTAAGHTYKTTAHPQTAADSTHAKKPDTHQTNTESAHEVDINQTVAGLNELAAQHNTSLNFSVDSSTGRTIIKIVDTQTDKVVRQLPPEELLELQASMEKVAGQLFRAKA